MNMQFWVNRAWEWGQYNIWMKDTSGRRVAYAQPITMYVPPPEEEGITKSPFMVLDSDAAQNLLDQLYEAGVRPSHGVDKGDVILAKDEHIKDLRTLVFSSDLRRTK